MVKTSVRGATMFQYVGVNFPFSEYCRLSLRFVVNNLTHVDSIVDDRMKDDIWDWIKSLNGRSSSSSSSSISSSSSSSSSISGNDSNKHHDVINSNNGSLYSSEVFRWVLDSYYQVWNGSVLGCEVGRGWYRAMIQITTRDEKEGPWMERALQFDGSLVGIPEMK